MQFSASGFVRGQSCWSCRVWAVARSVARMRLRLVCGEVFARMRLRAGRGLLGWGCRGRWLGASSAGRWVVRRRSQSGRGTGGRRLVLNLSLGPGAAQGQPQPPLGADWGGLAGFPKWGKYSYHGPPKFATFRAIEYLGTIIAFQDF
jgi:hypothetical protein